MQFSLTLFSSLTQTPINTSTISVPKTQPTIVAQSRQQSFQVNQAQVGGDTSSILITIIVLLVLILVGVLFKKPLISFLFSLLRLLSGQSQEEFSVPIKISNVRTKDYFRAEIEGIVYVHIEDEIKASSLESEEGVITNHSIVSSIFKDMFYAAMRQAASAKNLLEIHTDRETFANDVKRILEPIVKSSCLSVKSVVIGSVDESNTYNPDNYFDAQVIKQRLDIELATRTAELEKKPQIREKELEIEHKIREHELRVEEEIEKKELIFQKAHLTNNQELQTKKINCEVEIEEYRNSKENELEQKIEKTELDTTQSIETHRAKVEREIQKSQNKEATAIQLAKIEEDIKVANETKKFQILQEQLQQQLEEKEIQAVIDTIEKEKEKLTQEKERAEALEAITTAIEEARVQRVASEAEIIKTLAEAEEIRYKAVPVTDVDRMVKLIRDELIGKSKLPEITEVAKALAPQRGVLGEKSIYTFANGNGEEINKLMRSTSGMQLIHSLLDGKLGTLLESKSMDKKQDNE